MSIDTQQRSSIAQRLAHGAAKITGSSNSGIFPQYDDMVQLIGVLGGMIFPDFWSGVSCKEPKTTIQAQSKWIESELETARGLLECLLQQSLSTTDATKNLDAASLTDQYLGRLPDIQDVLLTDIQAAYDGDPACKGLPEVILCYPGVAAVVVYRLAHDLLKMGVPLLPRMMTEWVHGETGIDIHPGATIGKHFFIDHGTGVVIGETCEIGEHVKIYQGVTLGAISFDKDDNGDIVRTTKRHPTIEDNVVIYANATVLGGKTTVGHDSVIGSSVWLTRSVEPKTTVVMEKPKLRMRNDAPDDFVNFQI